MIIDRMQPMLGMERAIRDLLRTWAIETSTVVIHGSGAAISPYSVVTELCSTSGWRGRIRALGGIRRIIQSSDHGTRFIAVGIWAFAAAAISSIGLRKRVILWEHSILPWRLRHEPPVILGAVLLRALASRCERVVAVSHASQQCSKFLVWPFASVSVVGNVLPSVGSTNTSTPRDRGVIDLLGLGSLTKRKNWEVAIRAMAELPDNYRLQIAGDGPDLPRLRKIVHELRLSDRVSLLGYVENASTLLQHAHVLVHPSKAETFGYVLFEAAEQRVPVVTLDKPVMNEYVPRIVSGRRSKNDARQFATAITAALGPSQLEIADADLHRRAEFEISAIMNDWQSVVRDPHQMRPEE